MTGWEKELREYCKVHGTNTDMFNIEKVNMPDQQKKQLLQKWDGWNANRKQLRVKIQTARNEYLTKLVEDCKGGNASDIWKTIHTIAPRKTAFELQ